MMHSDFMPSEKAKSILPAGKCIGLILWNAKGILLIDYLEKG